jgi:hypothetical protein
MVLVADVIFITDLAAAILISIILKAKKMINLFRWRDTCTLQKSYFILICCILSTAHNLRMTSRNFILLQTNFSPSYLRSENIIRKVRDFIAR